MGKDTSIPLTISPLFAQLLTIEMEINAYLNVYHYLIYSHRSTHRKSIQSSIPEHKDGAQNSQKALRESRCDRAALEFITHHAVREGAGEMKRISKDFDIEHRQT